MVHCTRAPAPHRRRPCRDAIRRTERLRESVAVRRSEDLKKYRVIRMATQRNPDRRRQLVFIPDGAEIYAHRNAYRSCRLPRRRWEARPAPHFAGVLTVVAKLFNIVLPDVAILRQGCPAAAIVRAMVRDLNFPVEIWWAYRPRARRAGPVGRNVYLSPDDRRAPLPVSSLGTMQSLVAESTSRRHWTRRTQRAHEGFDRARLPGRRRPGDAAPASKATHGAWCSSRHGWGDPPHRHNTLTAP